MKYTKFIIRNYKAINNLEVPISNNVIPLIGVNESGKTSILNAILAFDRDKDSALEGLHLDAKNRYIMRQKDCEIIGCLTFESEEEFVQMGEELSLSLDSPIYHWLKDVFEQKLYIPLKRVFEDEKFTKRYSIVLDNEEIRNSSGFVKLERYITKSMPAILYFDDFSDRIPYEIPFSESYAKNKSLSTGKIREWQEIIQEIFSRSLEDDDLDLIEFIQIEDEDERSNFLSDVTSIVNDEIVNEWQKLKKINSNLESDSNISIKLKYELKDKKPTFKFKVSDSENSNKDRIFDISSRSKGFQWFFNFIIKLRFNARYRNNPKNAIFLLDEPGSYLHSSAQIGLLKVLKEFGENNTIIYCTHSQYLLDPDIINISGIKIVSKDKGIISMNDYGNSNSIRSLGSFSALNDALQLKFGIHDSMLRRCILTEGIIDYYFFKMFLNFSGISIIPGAGCGQLKDMISILISSSDKFLVILDNDSDGRKAESKYTHYFKQLFSENCYLYKNISHNNDFVLEDLLSLSDQEKIKKVAKCDNIKRALTILFFDEKLQSSLGRLDEESSRKIDIVKRKIEKHFNLYRPIK